MPRAAVVRVPASTSNLGAGFDCVGLAVDRWLTARAHVEPRDDRAPRIQRGGTLARLTIPAARDHVVIGFHAACAETGREVPGALAMWVESQIPVARGLGSSAAAVVAGAALADALLGLGLGRDGVAAIGARLEGHPDNVAPAVYGGARLAVMRDDRIAAVSALAVHESLALAFAVPDFEVETKAARAALPAAVPHSTAVAAAARGAALVRGLACADPALLALALDDVLHVPYRRALVRGHDEVARAATGAGAFGATLSGSGSTMVAVAPAALVERVEGAMRDAWRALAIAADTFHATRLAAGYEMSITGDA